MKIESPNKGEEKAPTSHLSLPSEFSVPGTSYILLLGKGAMEIPEQRGPSKFLNNSGHCQGCSSASLQTLMARFYCRRKHLHISLDMEEWSWRPVRAFALLARVYGT